MTRISTRFALLLAAAAVLPMLGYGAISIFSLRTGAQQAVIDGNLNVARQVAEQIELYVTGSVNILKAVAADLQQTGLQRWQQDRILKNFVLQFTEFRELTLLDDNGQPVVSSRLGKPTVTVPGSEGVNINGTLISRFSVDDALLPTAVIAARLADRDGGGWLVGRLNLEAMWRMVRPGGVLFARLASTIGMADRMQPLGGGRFLLPDGSERYLVDEARLMATTRRLDGVLLDPLKTTIVQDQRCMTTWVVGKPPGPV